MITRQQTPSSSPKISRSTATAKFIVTSPVLQLTPSHENAYCLWGWQKRTSHGKHIHRIYTRWSQLKGFLDTVSRLQRCPAPSFHTPATPRHLSQFLCRSGRFLKRSRERGVPSWYYSIQLETGNYIKLGRIEYLIIEVLDSKGHRRLKETSHLELNQGVHKVEEELRGSCKICLCEESTEEDPLINPCSCRGSC